MQMALLSWWRRSVLFYFFIFLFACGCNISDAGGADPLEQFTGVHTRVVWIQEQGDGADSFAFGNNFRLMGYDSRDGKKERPLLGETENLYKPILTPDGEKVVVSNRRQHKIYLVDFEKKKKVTLGKGVAVDVWQDPATGKVWVYALAGDGPENKYATSHPLIRFPLAEPSKREPVWDKTHLSWSNIDLSRDGKYIGGLFPWPHAGILSLEKNSWKQYGKGCWTALSPDNSAILWIFDGLHRNLNFINPFSSQVWTTNINAAPGIRGYEVYHPRWSNHVRYLTITGPYVEGEGGNKIKGGGRKVEVYIGRFSSDLKSVEKWLQVSHNDRADFYPDVWLASGGKSNLSGSLTEAVPLSGGSRGVIWPQDSKRLVFLWQDMLAENRLGDDSLLGFRQFRVSPVKTARYNRFLEMDLNRSGFTAAWSEKRALAAIKKENGFGLEFLYTPKATALQDSGLILRLRNEKEGDYLRFSQKGSDLDLEIFAGTASPGRIKLPGVLAPRRPEHLFLSLRGGRVQLYINGRLAGSTSLPAKPLSSWHDIRLVFGLPEGAAPGLDGSISHVGLYAGPVKDRDIIRSAQLVTGSLEERKNIDTVQFKGELVEASNVPSPDGLGAYRRALVVNRYRIVEMIRGTYVQKEILVAQWAVLDRTVLPQTSEFKEGLAAELSVERFDKHPELEGERLMMDMFDPDLEIYYQVRD